MLNRLPEAVESLGSDLQNQLLQILTKTTQQLLDASRFPADDPRLLPQLFSAVVTQLQRVVDAHRLAATAAVRAATRRTTRGWTWQRSGRASRPPSR